MYNGTIPSRSGAWELSCLCAPFRAFRFARPCLGGHPNGFSSDTAPGAVGNGSWFLSCKFLPDHKLQEIKRSYYHLVLGAYGFTGRQADY